MYTYPHNISYAPYIPHLRNGREKGREDHFQETSNRDLPAEAWSGL
jgi:hypothetical protein